MEMSLRGYTEDPRWHLTSMGKKKKKATVGSNITVFPFHVCCPQMIQARNEKLTKMPSNKFPFHEPLKTSFHLPFHFAAIDQPSFIDCFQTSIQPLCRCSACLRFIGLNGKVWLLFSD